MVENVSMCILDFGTYILILSTLIHRIEMPTLVRRILRLLYLLDFVEQSVSTIKMKFLDWRSFLRTAYQRAL